MSASTRPGSSHGSRTGFTLIEVLVVVAIIALLIAILMPSLRQAREEAKIVVCQSNSKQIANMIALYQADFRGHVPVMFNYHTGPVHNVNVGGKDTVPARTVLLSVALRGYAQDRRRLSDEFNPQIMWPNDKKNRYENTLLLDYFMCPFIRGKGDGWVFQGKVLISGKTMSRQYDMWTWDGRHESYHTWQWPNTIIRNQQPGSNVHPNDPDEGRPRYSALVWNKIKMGNAGGFDFNDPRLPNAHKVWDTSDARALKSASLSDVTVLHCAQGQRIDFGYVYHNRGSHRRGSTGGTNVTFADGHVGWVHGTRVGWP